jgi:hypothetical protein
MYQIQNYKENFLRSPVLGEDYEINFELITTSKTNSSSIE